MSKEHEEPEVEETEAAAEESESTPVAEEGHPEPKIPSLWQNYISLMGIVIATASILAIILLFLLELTAHTESPYLGILIYILLPSALVFGLFVIFLGIVFERRRRRKMSPEEIAAYPILDLNGPRRRRAFMT